MYKCTYNSNKFFFKFRLMMLPINLGYFCKTCISSSLLSWSWLSKRFPKHYMLLALVFPQSWKINFYWWRKCKLYKHLRDLQAGTVLTAISLITSFPGTRKCYTCFQRRNQMTVWSSNDVSEPNNSPTQKRYLWTTTMSNMAQNNKNPGVVHIS